MILSSLTLCAYPPRDSMFQANLSKLAEINFKLNVMFLILLVGKRIADWFSFSLNNVQIWIILYFFFPFLNISTTLSYLSFLLPLPYCFRSHLVYHRLLFTMHTIIYLFIYLFNASLLNKTVLEISRLPKCLCLLAT